MSLTIKQTYKINSVVQVAAATGQAARLLLPAYVTDLGFDP